ncbi:MAG: hypothetical protein K0R07_176 [Sedimentibacter sp.]|jgi:hypothetical protein|nr:hypothetical protein [Sedimentibacter sp.]
MALLDEVKNNLGITVSDANIDLSINSKITAVKLYLVNGGAVIEDIPTELEIACISIGVNDLLNNNAGETKFSPAFDMLARQICRG